ncbi:MAG: flagellar biosynthetic protein FliR [Syntrophobacterales bacterium]|nr:flagellar biosynthetic protein FliR [Syntrophobacterales bacterium]
MKFTVVLQDVLIFLAVFLRIGIAVVTFPFLRATEIPTTFKALMAFFVSLVFYLPLSGRVVPIPTDPILLGSLILGELIFGILLSFALLIILGAFELAGEIISFQMGFGFTQVADPLTGVQITLISRFLQFFATLLFFAVDGHHLIITAVYKSFESFPVGFLVNVKIENIAPRFIALSASCFTLAIKISAPIIVVLFLTELGMGLIVKFAPQINILVVGFAVTILVGTLFASLSIGNWGTVVLKAFKEAFSIIMDILYVRQ